LAQFKSPVKSFLPHTIWVINLFVFIFLIWWAPWEFRDAQWIFPRYTYVLIAPTLLYFACSLLMPQQPGGTEVDLEEYFFQIRRPPFISYFLTTLVIMIDGNLLADDLLWHGGRFGNPAMLGLAVCT
jgi:hypothetical protein